MPTPKPAPSQARFAAEFWTFRVTRRETIQTEIFNGGMSASWTWLL